MDRLSGTYALFVTFVGFLIHVFAVGYMRGEAGFYRFFAFLNLFMFAMLTLVLGDNFVLMFVGWEGVGLCSYLLIGYYIDRKEAGDAAKKAFITNRIGDWGFVLGIMLTFFVTGSVSFSRTRLHLSRSVISCTNGPRLGRCDRANCQLSYISPHCFLNAPARIEKPGPRSSNN